MYTKGRKTSDGHDLTWGTNHLGPFLLTELLMPMLEKASASSGVRSRIVNVSSIAHRHFPMDFDRLDFDEDSRVEMA